MNEMATKRAPELGGKLRAHRKARQLTLKELSERTNVSTSMLSQIERGQTNPTVATVWSLTQALGISIDGLLSRAAPEAEVGAPARMERLKAHMTPMVRSEDGKCEVRILNPVATALTAEWYEMRFEPGGILRSDPHPSRGTESLTVLQGTVEITSGEETVTAVAGETFRYPADRPHSIANIGTSSAVVLVVLLYQ